ncbi:MAG: hypothetical protein KDI09_20035, partial [Halioglobus sp.]|nr:hypothetical protein [Halioglobus sp.]
MITRILASRGTGRLLHLVTAMLLALLTLQPALAGNDRYRQDIEQLRALHLIALPASIVTPPPFDKPAELTEYGSNIALKFVPTVVEPPPPVVVRPNNGSCAFRYMKYEHPLDPVFDVEDIFGFPLELPSDWGRLDDGAPGTGDEHAPSFFHYNSGSYVTVRRSLYEYEPDPEPWYPQQTRARLSGQEILFTNTNDRQDIIEGAYRTDTYEEFPVGTTALEWEAENKIDILFDVAFQPLIFIAEMKHAARAAAKAQKAKRFARNWGDLAVAWRRSIDQALWRAISRKSAEALGTLGLEVSADKLENATGQELTSWPTGTFNRVRQNFMVLDEIPPVVEMTQQPAPFEANTLGGEFGNRHFDELRGLLSVSDTCDRPVDIDSEPRGTRFWPVNQTTTLQWCGRDPGPNSATGGRNEACADINVQVVDTRPPLMLLPPGVNVISTAPANTLDVGRAGVFDVADPEVV